MVIIVILFVAAGCFYDVKSFNATGRGEIPKWCTIPVFLLGVFHNVSADGWNGLTWSLVGSIGVVAVYLSILKSALSIGFGDLKLLMGAGAYAGVKEMGFLLIVMFTLSGLMMLVRFVRKNKSYTPLTFCRAAGEQLRNGPDDKERIPFAPYIGAPFIVYLLIKISWQGV
ncbi:MAG: Type IV leader peptidase family protein [Pelotomaculum sp. PtaU1.Bin065]|nr:MAG: Type IV leader peptidase family protein [Pelotomaculum sp. PtaU1.Bin065]